MKGGMQFIGGQALLSDIHVDKQEEIAKKNLDCSVKASTVSCSLFGRKEQRGTKKKNHCNSFTAGGDV